jgi:serine/threonine protein kinase
VAIKVLPPAVAADADRLRRFEQEARAAGALNHPNILVVYEFGLHAGAPFIVAELLDGRTLREVLEDGPLPVRKAVQYAIEVTRGLAAAHDKGSVHRDLKPENVFVTTDDRVKILDFGLAKLRQPAGADARDARASDPTARETGAQSRKPLTRPKPRVGSLEPALWRQPGAQSLEPPPRRQVLASCWAPSATWHPSRCVARRSITGPTSSPWAQSSMSC